MSADLACRGRIARDPDSRTTANGEPIAYENPDLAAYYC